MFMTTEIIIPQSYETRVYLNVSGGVTIEQKGGEHDDIITLLSKEQCRALARAINALAKEATFIPETEEEE